MIAVFREIEVSDLPSKFIEPIASIRSAVFAVNARIDEVFETETKRNRMERRERLRSAGRVLQEARQELEKLGDMLFCWHRAAAKAQPLSPEMSKFMSEPELSNDRP